MTAPLQDQHKCVALIISCRKYLYTRAAKQDTSALPFKDIVVQPFPPDEYRKAFFWDDE